jgi:ketosteroid isomerase-like protein
VQARADPEGYDAGMMIETATQTGPQTGADEATLTQLNQQYVNAFLNSNVEWYQEHVIDDFVCIESDGTMLDKASFLLDTAKGPGAVAAYRLVTVRVRILGETAFIHAQGQATRTDGTQIHSRYTDVWVRQRGEWKAASAQITRIAG